MPEQKNENELTPEELEDQDGKPLPPREVMSIIDPGDGSGLWPVPVDPKETTEWGIPVEPATSTDET